MFTRTKKFFRRLWDFTITRKFGTLGWFCESDTVGKTNYQVKLKPKEELRSTTRFYRKTTGPYSSKMRAEKSLGRLKNIEEKDNKKFEKATSSWARTGH